MMCHFRHVRDIDWSPKYNSKCSNHNQSKANVELLHSACFDIRNRHLRATRTAAAAIIDRGMWTTGKCIIINVLWLSQSCQMLAKCQLHGRLASIELLADRGSLISDRWLLEAKWTLDWALTIDLMMALTFKRQPVKCQVSEWDNNRERGRESEGERAK